MLFNSFEFLVFFPIVLILYFSLPHKARLILLLISSYVFYMFWKVEYILLILASTLTDYFISQELGRTTAQRKRDLLLWSSVAINLGILVAFKYLNFITFNISELFGIMDLKIGGIPVLDVLLPVGISFYTFQTLGYTIDVYRGQIKPERSYIRFALYVSFFPQLVAGPIERAKRLLPQFYVEHKIDPNRISSGLRLMMWGFFKKVVIADRLAEFVNVVYNNPGDHQGFAVILATYFFAFQIYCDFSGYSDIAIGSARIMGYDLMKNFDRPYFSKSISEFWSRWHISLSSWFRDYLYIPLGGNRVIKWRWYYNLMITFLISGFWHGANWTFLAWGFLHGTYLLIGIWGGGFKNWFNNVTGLDRSAGIKRIFDVLLTFHLALFAWIFFRANNITDAFQLIESMIHIKKTQLGLYIFGPGTNYKDLILVFVFLALMHWVHLIQTRTSMTAWLASKPVWFRWSIYYGMILTLLFFGKYQEQEFIYFQF
ncbi:MAG: MBOAT family protein [Bacteroidetes bacterium]|nr:MBOAT family protein [Bacteroidota bacterium]